MSRKGIGIWLLCAAACRAHEPAHESAAASAQCSFARSLELDFAESSLGEAPASWIVARTGRSEAPASWRVAESDGVRCVRVVDASSRGAVFNLLVSHREFPSDLELSVELGAESGAEDRGGGLIWRAKDCDDYYVTRWNPLESNVRIDRVEHGVRHRLGEVAVAAESSGWHELSLRSIGVHHEVWFDGVLRLSIDDDAFLEPGKIGLWTKADAATRFRLLRVAWND